MPTIATSALSNSGTRVRPVPVPVQVPARTREIRPRLVPEIPARPIALATALKITNFLIDFIFMVFFFVIKLNYKL